MNDGDSLAVGAVQITAFSDFLAGNNAHGADAGIRFGNKTMLVLVIDILNQKQVGFRNRPQIAPDGILSRRMDHVQDGNRRIVQLAFNAGFDSVAHRKIKNEAAEQTGNDKNGGIADHQFDMDGQVPKKCGCVFQRGD